MIKIDRMQFQIEGKIVEGNDILEWEYSRLIKNYKLLKKITGAKFNTEFPKWIQDKDIQKMEQDLLRIKMELGLARLREIMKKKAKIGNKISAIGVKLARGKRKFSTTEIYVPESNLSPEEVIARITNIIMVNNEQHLKINLDSNPDHYVLQSLSEHVQEVLEVTGGSPLPTHFYCHYGEVASLQSKRTTDYQAEIAGAAKLENGFVIGGVRHQVKKEGNGFRFKALVEFPSAVSDKMIEAHEYHLACEFGHWLSTII